MQCNKTAWTSGYADCVPEIPHSPIKDGRSCSLRRNTYIAWKITISYSAITSRVRKYTLDIVIGYIRSRRSSLYVVSESTWPGPTQGFMWPPFSCFVVCVPSTPPLCSHCSCLTSVLNLEWLQRILRLWSEIAEFNIYVVSISTSFKKRLTSSTIFCETSVISNL